MPKKSGPDYPDVFRRPIRRSKLSAGARPAGRTAAHATDKEMAKEFTFRLLALANFYSIDLMAPSGCLQLLLAVLQRHVPGFRIANPAGRQRWWTQARLMRLYDEVQALRAKRFSIPMACRKLAADKRYRELSGGSGAANLLRNYKEARRHHRWSSLIAHELSLLDPSTSGTMTETSLPAAGPKAQGE